MKSADNSYSSMNYDYSPYTRSINYNNPPRFHCYESMNERPYNMPLHATNYESNTNSYYSNENSMYNQQNRGNTNTPNMSSPNRTMPNMTTPNMTSPNMTSPNMTSPNRNTPNMTTPNITSPNMTSPNMTMPNRNMPNMTSPNMTSPNMTSPNMTMPNRNMPNMTSPNMTSPNMTMPNRNMPNMASPNMTSPNMTMPNRNMPNMTSPNMTSPSVNNQIPVYGGDNYYELEQDLEYFKQMYPKETNRILDFIIDECDKLEFEGSSMFDQYPDKNTLSNMVDRIYQNVNELQSQQVDKTATPTQDMEIINSEKLKAQETVGNSSDKLVATQFDRRDNNWLRRLIEVLLFNEMFHRRRRFRNRRRRY